MKPTALAWDNFATRESKSKIMLRLLASWIYNLVEGVLFSLSSLLLFVPGIFIASLAAIPAALINGLKIRRLSEMKERTRQPSVLKLAGWSVWSFIDFIYVPILAILFVRLVNSWWP